MNCPFCDPKTREAQTFYQNNSVYCMPSIRPAVPGHVLVIPKRHVERFEDLEEKEILDIFESVKKVYSALRKTYRPEGFNLVIQDGKAAGQTVNHLHMHVCPRIAGDMTNKEFYKKVLVDDQKRKRLSEKEMGGLVQDLKFNS